MIVAEIVGTVCGAASVALPYSYWTWSYYAPSVSKYLAKRKRIRANREALSKALIDSKQDFTKTLNDEAFDAAEADKDEADIVADLDTAMRAAPMVVSPFSVTVTPSPAPNPGANPKASRKKKRAATKAERKGSMPVEPFVTGPEELHCAETDLDITPPDRVKIKGRLWRRMGHVARAWTCVSCIGIIHPQTRAYRGVKGKESKQRMCVTCACKNGKEL